MTNFQERGHLLTEQVNPNSLNLDQLNSLELVELFNSEDQKAVAAVAAAKVQLAAAIDLHSRKAASRWTFILCGCRDKWQIRSIRCC